MKITITKRISSKSLHSLSAIEIIDSRIFVIGDDSPELHEIDENGKIKNSIRVIPKNEFEGGILPKHLKPDLESMCKVEFVSGNFLFIFGSGSKSPQRDVLFVVDPDGKIPVKKYSLFDFYSLVRLKCNIKSDDLNIEAAVYHDEKILLFNRGNNFIIEFPIEDLFQHLVNNKYQPDFKIYRIFLPVLKNIPAGFSGADIYDDKIFFTASVENTFNWIDDGEVLGSYLGFISLKNLKDKYKPPCKLISENNEVLKLKIEGIAIRNISANKTELILVSDSDGGEWEMVFCEV